MNTFEVKRENWQRVCHYISENLKGALVTIEVVRPDGSADELASDIPLWSLSLDEQHDPCSDELTLEAGLPNEKPVRHLMIEPIHIVFKALEEDRYHRMEVHAENGTTAVNFHPGLDAAWLEEMNRKAETRS